MPYSSDDSPETNQGGARVETATATAPTREPFVDRLAERLAGAAGTLVGSRRKPPRRLKSLLNGTPFGHPVHPAIIDIPIGVWLLTAICDALWLVVPGTSDWAARASEVAVLTGIVAALAAVVTGTTDWSDTFGAERRKGLYHGLLMTSAVVLYVVSAVLRFTTPQGNTVLAAILGFVGLAIVLFGAYLGGDMVFGFGTGVDHTAWQAGPEDFVSVARYASLPEHGLQRVEAAGVPIVLLRMGERVYAIGATCPHAGGPLDEGALEGTVVECPWHSSRFDMRSGRVLTGPATKGARRYEVRVREGQVEVKSATSH